MRKIKVLHTEWSDGWGGQEIRIINEMLAVQEQGVEVFLACKVNSKIKDQAINNGIKVFILPFRGNVDLKTMFSLIKIIKDYQIDIVNTHSGKDTWVGGIAAKLSGSKFIRTRHLSNLINSRRFNFINELADFVFTTGESVRTDMIEFNRIDPRKIISIPTGIDEEIFDPILFDSEAERNKLNVDNNVISIGILAVIRKFKRHDLFVEMAAELTTRHTNLKFFIAGDGPIRDEIEEKIKKMNLQESVFLLGHIDEAAKFLSSLDIFTLTSDSKEGVPQSVMQALLMNKKVVATNAGSTRDLYNDDNFSLVDTNNLAALVEATESFIKNKRNTELNTRSYIVDNFSKTCMTNKIMKVYRQILNVK